MGAVPRSCPDCRADAAPIQLNRNAPSRKHYSEYFDRLSTGLERNEFALRRSIRWSLNSLVSKVVFIMHL